MTVELIPISNISLEITFSPSLKKEFLVLFYSTDVRVAVGLLFPSVTPGHKDEIPEWMTLNEAKEGATSWSWKLGDIPP